MEKRCKKKIPPFKQALRAAFEPVRKGSEQQRANEGTTFPFLNEINENRVIFRRAKVWLIWLERKFSKKKSSS